LSVANIVNNAGANFFSDGGTVTATGQITNAGSFVASGAINGAIVNQNAGTFVVDGALTGNNTFTNNDTAVLNVQFGNLAGITTLTNNSTAANAVHVFGGRTLSVANIVNNAGANFFSDGGTVTATGQITNAGSFAASGTINGAIVNQNAGTFTVDGALVVNNTFTNNNTAVLNVQFGNFTGITTLTNNSTAANAVHVFGGRALSATNIVNNAGANFFSDGGTVTATGQITNAGSFTASGTINGAIVNQNAGTFVVDGALVANNTFTNSNTAVLNVQFGNFTGITTLTNTSTAAIGVDVGAGRTLTVSGLVTNGNGLAASTIRVQAGGTLNAGGLLNRAFSVVNNFGTINDVLDNAGLINNNGIWNATVNTNTGTINNNAAGVWTGDVNSNAGTIINAGTWTTTGPAGFNNSAGDLITTNLLDATLGGLTNRGQASASGEIRGAITNTDAGTFVVTGALLGNSSFTNSGPARLDVTGGNFTGITTLTNSSIEPIGVLIAAGRTLGATTLVNAAGAGISNSGTLTITGQITNSGTITVTATGSMTAAGITNNLGGTITNFGTVIDDLDNAGLINNNGIWIATVNTNSGTINNNATGTWTGNVTSSAGTIVNSGIWNGNVISNTGTLTNNLTWTGNITSSGTFSNAATGTVTGNLTNSGTASNTGTITGSVTNTAGTFTQTAGSVGGGLTNSATVNANGGAVNGVILNQGAGTFTVGGNVTGNNSFTNSGTAQLAVTGGNFTGITTLTNTSTAAVGVNVTGFTLATSGLVTNGNGVAASTMQVGAGGTLTAGGGFQNNFNSTINLTAATSAANGNLANGGTVTNAGTWTGNVTSNGGTITNNNIWTGAAINATGLISNTGTWTTTPGGFTNGSNFFNTGTLNATTGGMTNTGTALVSGTINGAIANNTAGIFQVTGGALSTTGSFSNNNSAELRLINSSYAVTGPIANNNTATINLLAPGLTLSSTTTVTNAAAAAINMNAGTLVGTAGITNAGTINLLTGANALGGNVTNSGVLALGTTTTTVGITGSLTGNAGNSITVPINLTTGVAASVAATGAATGTNNVVFGVTGGGGLFAPTVITTTAGGSGTFAGTGLPAQVGLVNYAYTAVGPNQTVVTAVPAAAAVTAPMTSILGTLSSVETSFHQSASALVASPQSQEPNKWSGGVWSRGSGGYSNVTSNGTASLISPLGVFSTQSSTRIDTRFAGYQVGLDGALLNVGNSGWNAHLGVTAGDVEAKSNDLFSSVNFTSGRFVGVYAVFTRGAFFSDIGYRHTSYDAEVTSSIVNLSKASLKGRGDNINASAGYQFRFGDHFIEPSAGISVTRSTFDSINGTLPIVGNPTSYTLAFNELKSTLARIGVRAGFTSVVQNTVALSPFVTGSVWREFEQNAGGQFIAISSVPVTTVLTTALTTDRVGTFYQAGAGVSAQVLNTGFLAFVRGDFRIGNKLDAASLHAGARYTFGP
jgi:hypothetical protein